jgi:hypothetical protein
MSTQGEALCKQALHHGAKLRLSLGRVGGVDINRGEFMIPVQVPGVVSGSAPAC